MTFDSGLPAWLDKHTIRFSRQLSVDKDALWRAISTKAGLDSWFMETELELKIGGRYSFKDGWDGWISELQEGQLIRFNSAADAWTQLEIIPTASGCEFRLTDRLNSQLTMEDQPNGPGTHNAALLAGWHDFVNALCDYLLGNPITDQFEELTQFYQHFIRQ